MIAKYYDTLQNVFRLERSPSKWKVWCSNPNLDETQSLKQVGEIVSDPRR